MRVYNYNPPIRGAGRKTKIVASRRGMLTAMCLFALTSGCEQKKVAPVLPPPEVAVSRPLQQDVTDALEFTGTMAALESVEIRARVSGFLEQVHFVPRAKVNKGDLLFTIDPRPFEDTLASAMADRDSKKAKLVKAEFDQNKIAELFPAGMASQDELTKKTATRDDMKAQVAAADAQVAEAQLRLGWCRVTSPIHGRISRNMIDPGNIVDADKTVLATIVNDDDLYAYFNASEHDVLAVREQTTRMMAAPGHPASRPDVSVLRPPAFMGLMNETGFPHAGFLDYVSPELDSSTGTIQMRGRFSNSDEALISGLFARVRVPLGSSYKALLVSERALGSDQGDRYLLIVNDKNIVEYRLVKTGPLQGSLRVIAEGIGPQDQIIVTGLQRVRPGITVKPQEIPMPAGPAVSATTASAPSSQPSQTTSQPIKK